MSALRIPELRKPALRSSAAHTLIEMLVALAVAGILAGAAVPNLQAVLQKQQLRAALNDLLGAIDLTRSLAIARGGVVLMAPADSSGAAWQHGWTIFADRNANRRPDAGEERISIQQPWADGVRLASRFTSGTGAQYLAYNECDAEVGHVKHGLVRSRSRLGRNLGDFS